MAKCVSNHLVLFSLDKAAMRSDAAAELDRLTRNKKTPAAIPSTAASTPQPPPPATATINNSTDSTEC